MGVGWSEIQRLRLQELAVDAEALDSRFESTELRDHAFQRLEKQLVRRQRADLQDFLTRRLRPRISLLENRLIGALNAQGFSQMVTPTLISREDLSRMSIGRDHAFNEQIYWVDGRRCLRPMLAPNLYRLMRHLARLQSGPVRIFEVGSCFRRETGGARHTSEFTMLNLVEMRVPKGKRRSRLETLAAVMMEAAGITDYRLEGEASEVYGQTVDVVSGPENLEVASCAMGPHPLDGAWGVVDTWVGLGFGLERLLMVREHGSSIGRWCRSNAYLDGIRLTL
jgi:phenylalanyl-tRNA synthetase alpha chain